MSLTGLLLQLILFPWQLPQNLLGLGFGLYLRCRGRIAEMKWERNRCFLRTDTAVSLALFIFWKIDYDDPVFFLPSVNREHEYGHSIQSLLLDKFLDSEVGPRGGLQILGRNSLQRDSNCHRGFHVRLEIGIGDCAHTVNEILTPV